MTRRPREHGVAAALIDASRVSHAFGGLWAGRTTDTSRLLARRQADGEGVQRHLTERGVGDLGMPPTDWLCWPVSDAAGIEPWYHGQAEEHHTTTPSPPIQAGHGDERSMAIGVFDLA
jgi:hypothetical protein